MRYGRYTRARPAARASPFPALHGISPWTVKHRPIRQPALSLMEMETAQVILYSRDGCHLCEEVRTQLETLRKEHGFMLTEVDIDRDARLRERYDHDVPVVTVNGVEALRHHWRPRAFLKALPGR